MKEIYLNSVLLCLKLLICDSSAVGFILSALLFVYYFHPQTGFPLLEDVCKCSIWNHILFLYSGRSESITTCFIKQKSWALLWLDQLETIRVRKKIFAKTSQGLLLKCNDWVGEGCILKWKLRKFMKWRGENVCFLKLLRVFMNRIYI